MKYGTVLEGESEFDELRWEHDELPNLNNNDALWGFMIRAAAETTRHTSEQMRDPVLHRLFTMGIYDWVKPNDLSWQNTQMIRYSTAMGLALWKRIRGLEREVCRLFGPIVDLVVTIPLDRLLPSTVGGRREGLERGLQSY